MWTLGCGTVFERDAESEKSREKCETLYCGEGEKASLDIRFPGFARSSF
jgi:hypothetical protein